MADESRTRRPRRSGARTRPAAPRAQARAQGAARECVRSDCATSAASLSRCTSGIASMPGSSSSAAPSSSPSKPECTRSTPCSTARRSFVAAEAEPCASAAHRSSSERGSARRAAARSERGTLEVRAPETGRVGMTTCPRCREPLASGQEYCLACGARLTDAALRSGSSLRSSWALRSLAAGVVALVGAAAAIAATGSDGGRPRPS